MTLIVVKVRFYGYCGVHGYSENQTNIFRWILTSNNDV